MLGLRLTCKAAAHLSSSRCPKFGCFQDTSPETVILAGIRTVMGFRHKCSHAQVMQTVFLNWKQDAMAAASERSKEASWASL